MLSFLVFKPYIIILKNNDGVNQILETRNLVRKWRTTFWLIYFFSDGILLAVFSILVPTYIKEMIHILVFVAFQIMALIEHLE